MNTPREYYNHSQLAMKTDTPPSHLALAHNVEVKLAKHDVVATQDEAIRQETGV